MWRLEVLGEGLLGVSQEHKEILLSDSWLECRWWRTVTFIQPVCNTDEILWCLGLASSEYQESQVEGGVDGTGLAIGWWLIGLGDGYVCGAFGWGWGQAVVSYTILSTLKIPPYKEISYMTSWVSQSILAADPICRSCPGISVYSVLISKPTFWRSWKPRPPLELLKLCALWALKKRKLLLSLCCI